MPKIIIQAGHSGRTSGATGAPNEQAHNIYVSDKLAELLRAKGFEVRRVTADPTSAQIAGDWDLFFVVHYDADIYGSGGGFLDRPAVDGASAKSKAILEAIESKYFPTTGIVNKPQRRNANTANYYMWSKISSLTPCVLIECGVGMHKPDDYDILQNNRDLEVDGLYKGMLKAFNMEDNMADTIQVEKTVFEALVTKATKYDEIIKIGYVLTPDAERVIKEKNDVITTKDDEIVDLRKKLTECENKPTTPAPTQPDTKWQADGMVITKVISPSETQSINYKPKV
jgi:hypothetical protein